MVAKRFRVDFLTEGTPFKKVETSDLRSAERSGNEARHEATNLVIYR